MLEPGTPKCIDTRSATAEDALPINSETREAEIELQQSLDKSKSKMRRSRRLSKRASVIPDAQPKIQKALDDLRTQNAFMESEAPANKVESVSDLPVPDSLKPFILKKRSLRANKRDGICRTRLERSAKTPGDVLPH